MKKFEELLKNEKVEWKKIGDIITKFSEKQRNKVNLKLVYTVSKEYGLISSKEYWKNKERREDYTVYSEDLSNYNIIKKNMFAYNPARLNIGSIDCLFDREEGILSPMYTIFSIDEEIINSKYLLYFIKSPKILKIINDKKEEGARFRFDFNRWKKIEIPIPSLETQEKIVKILDNFTNYVTELQARVKQYQYYRDMLLSEGYLRKISEERFLKTNSVIEIYKLNEVVEIKRGKRLVKSQLSELEKYPVFQNSLIPLGYYKDKNFEGNKTCIISAGAAGDIFYQAEDFWAADDVFVLSPSKKIVDKYLYYFLLSKQEFIKSKVRKASIPRLSRDEVEKIDVLIPSLELQNKIVEVLDKFQSLLSDTKGLLPQEIEQRQKQYEYYREKLLTFEVKCDTRHDTTRHDTTRHDTTRHVILNSYFILLKEAAQIVNISLSTLVWKRLGEVGRFENGTGMPKTMFDNHGEVLAIHYGHIYTKYNIFVKEPIVKVSMENAKNLKKVKKGNLVIAKTSENLDDVMKTVAYLGEDEVVTGGHSAIFRHGANPKYLSYVFNGADYFIKQKNKLAHGVKVIELSTTDMEKFQILIPPIHIQEYIVSILDKFDMLTNDLTQGLPREIELRQKQYEYYREKLFDFLKNN